MCFWLLPQIFIEAVLCAGLHARCWGPVAHGAGPASFILCWLFQNSQGKLVQGTVVLTVLISIHSPTKYSGHLVKNPGSWCNPLCSIKRKRYLVLVPGTEFLKSWGSPDFFGVLTRVSWLRGFWIASEWGLVPERPNYDWKLGTQSSLGVWERDWRWRLITKGHWFNQRPLVCAHVTKPP